MEKEKNVSELLKEISGRLLDAKYLLDIIQDLIESSSASEISILTLNSIILDYVASSFKDVENCRSLICINE